MNRRFFLKSAGGALLAAPILTSLRRDATAEEPVAPRRSVIFHSPLGCITTRWFPKVENGPLDADAFAGTSLSVLAPLASKLLVPRGMRGVNQFGKPQTIDPHAQATGSKLTCALLDPDTRHATSHSLDHEIARQLNPNAAPPLVLSTLSSTSPGFAVSYSAANAPVEPIVNPLDVYLGLSDVLGGGEALHRLRRKQSILDAVSDDLATYQRLDMSRSDQRRVETWLELVREVEVGMEMQACDPSRVGVSKAAVEEATTSALADRSTVGLDMLFKLMALTLLCDTNRSLVIHFPGSVVFQWDGIEHTSDHDGLAHRTGSSFVGGNCVPGVLDMLGEIDRWYATQFGELVSLLDGLEEGEGTLLDNTATMWLNEFSDGAAMNVNNLPVMIAGSAGGYLKNGVAVNVEGAPVGAGNSEASCGPDGDGIAHPNTGSTSGNVPINKLYVTLLNALGCEAPGGGEVTAFGQFDGEDAEAGITQPGELATLKA